MAGRYRGLIACASNCEHEVHRFHKTADAVNQGPLSREIHGGSRYAGHRQQGLLDPSRARRTGHARNREFAGLTAQVVSRSSYRVLQIRGIDQRRGVADLCLLTGEIHGDIDSRQRTQRLLHPACTLRTGHPFDGDNSLHNLNSSSFDRVHSFLLSASASSAPSPASRPARTSSSGRTAPSTAARLPETSTRTPVTPETRDKTRFIVVAHPPHVIPAIESSTALVKLLALVVLMTSSFQFNGTYIRLPSTGRSRANLSRTSSRDRPAGNSIPRVEGPYVSRNELQFV